ncbi:hypothetical protein [Thermosipho atlanticus]|uniref:Uncharacterized protein n=1 Tax=Thermosipho atlanticus DSM 15807 TaxID=1123380 RepID=A0A1M5SSZ0_9BACT|nr:hypothetical protein [Thermosipho atlanticus]SHH41651.1 hypothetical protein SAMN02745199_1066 [Thermosipho atlanticus DSM 15807]
MIKIFIWLLLSISMIIFPINIYYTLIVPTETPTNTIQEISNFILENNPKISLTDYGLNQKSYEYLYSPYHEDFQKHVLTLLDYFLFKKIDSEYVLPLNFIEEFKIQDDVYLYCILLFDNNLKVIAKSFNEHAFDENGVISTDALNIYNSLIELIKNTFEDDSPKNYDIDNILMTLYFDISDNGNIILEITFISKAQNSIDLTYFIM